MKKIMTEDLFADFPEDPELAFLKLLGHFERELEKKIQGSEERSDTSIFLVD